MDVHVGTYYGSSHARDDDTSTRKASSYCAVLDHRFNDAFNLKNTTRLYNYKLDRYNTLSNGNTNPTALTIHLSQSALLRDESGWFNQTDFTYKTNIAGMKNEILFVAEVGQQKRRAAIYQGGTIATLPFFGPRTVVVTAFTAVQLSAVGATPNNTQ